MGQPNQWTTVVHTDVKSAGEKKSNSVNLSYSFSKSTPIQCKNDFSFQRNPWISEGFPSHYYPPHLSINSINLLGNKGPKATYKSQYTIHSLSALREFTVFHAWVCGRDLEFFFFKPIAVYRGSMHRSAQQQQTSGVGSRSRDSVPNQYPSAPSSTPTSDATPLPLLELPRYRFLRNLRSYRARVSLESGARFTKYLTNYHKIILSLSQNRLTVVIYKVLRSLLRIS